jgi:hypothetical protein
MRTGACAILAVFAAFALPAGASAANERSYILKHPKRERCKAHYARRVKRAKVHDKSVRRVWCVYARRKANFGPTPTFTFVTALERGGVLAEQPPYETVSAAVDTYGGGLGNRLLGVPVTVTLANHATGAALGSFTEISYAAPCTIVPQLSARSWVLTGQAAATYPGCPITAVTAPAAQGISILDTFAGNARYAPSKSKAKLFVGPST